MHQPSPNCQSIIRVDLIVHRGENIQQTKKLTFRTNVDEILLHDEQKKIIYNIFTYVVIFIFTDIESCMQFVYWDLLMIISDRNLIVFMLVLQHHSEPFTSLGASV